MDIATGLGLAAGAAVVCTLILLGGDFRMFYDLHAIIVIFGGSFAATLIRFPLSAIFHGLPLGAKYAFTLRRNTQRDLVDELASLAEIARKQGPMGLEKVEVNDPFLATGVRFVADSLRQPVEPGNRDRGVQHISAAGRDEQWGPVVKAAGIKGTS